MNKTARVIITYDCPRNCAGCCNKDWKYSPAKSLTVEALHEADTIIITGGEPFINQTRLLSVIERFKSLNKTATMLVYTALLKNNIIHLVEALYRLDGMTVTLHEQKDVEHFKPFNLILKKIGMDRKGKSLRLNIFKNVNVGNIDLSLWTVKDNIEWIKDCPLPKNETLYKYLI